MQLESVEFHRYWISHMSSCVILYPGSILGWNAVVTSISLLGLTWPPRALCDGHVAWADGVTYSTTGSDLWDHSVLWEEQEVLNSQNQELNLAKEGSWLSQQDLEPLTEVVLRWCTHWAKRVKARCGCQLFSHHVWVVLQPQKKLELPQITASSYFLPILLVCISITPRVRFSQTVMQTWPKNLSIYTAGQVWRTKSCVSHTDSDPIFAVQTYLRLLNQK